MSFKPPVSPMSQGRSGKSQTHTRMSRESSALLRFDMRLPARVKAELRAGKQGKAVREYIDKANIRPVLVKCGRHETLRQYFEAMDKDKSGTLEFKEVKRWLPKIGMDNVEFREAVDNHFRFMDKDGSEEIDFKEFAESTIDAADQKLSCYADEQYAKKFGMEIYMFLALCGRNKALKQFERDEAKAYEPGNELLPFFQFERLMKSSQAVFMPFELYAPEDDSLTGQRRAARRPSSATRKKEAAQTASAINSAAKSVFTEFSSSSFSSSSSASSASVVREDNSLFNEQALSNDNNNDNNNGQNAASSPTLQIEPRTFDVEDEDNEDGNLSTPASATMVDLNDNDGLGQLISATESMSNSDVGGNVDGSGGGGGGSSSKPKHRASQKVGSNNSNEGYEELWGLGSSGISGSFGSDKITKEIVKEIEQGLIENKRAWAIRRRAEIIKSQKSVKLPQHSPTKLNDKIENLTGGKTKLGATNYKLTMNKKSEKRNSKLPTIIRKS